MRLFSTAWLSKRVWRRYPADPPSQKNAAWHSGCACSLGLRNLIVFFVWRQSVHCVLYFPPGMKNSLTVCVWSVGLCVGRRADSPHFPQSYFFSWGQLGLSILW